MGRAHSGSRRRLLVLRPVVRQRPSCDPGADAEQVLCLHGPNHGNADRGQTGTIPADHDRARGGPRAAEGPERSRDSRRGARRLSQMVHHAAVSHQPSSSTRIRSSQRARSWRASPAGPPARGSTWRTSRPLSTSRANGSWAAMARCPTSRCRARTWPRPRSSRRWRPSWWSSKGSPKPGSSSSTSRSRA